MIDYLIFLPIGYLIGSVPFGIIAGLLFGAGDIRRMGSGKSGMTNVMRTVGVKVAVTVLLLDMGKAVIAVTIARSFEAAEGAVAGAGLAALIGHVWPVFAGFKGGRGTAPGWGGLIILSPIAGLVATLIGLPLVGLSRYVSVGSIAASGLGALTIVVMAAMGYEPREYMWYGIVGGPLIVYLHKDNIRRLVRGEERRIGQKARPATEEAGSVESAGA